MQNNLGLGCGFLLNKELLTDGVSECQQNAYADVTGGFSAIWLKAKTELKVERIILSGMEDASQVEPNSHWIRHTTPTGVLPSVTVDDFFGFPTGNPAYVPYGKPFYLATGGGALVSDFYTHSQYMLYVLTR